MEGVLISVSFETDVLNMELVPTCLRIVVVQVSHVYRVTWAIQTTGRVAVSSQTVPPSMENLLRGEQDALSSRVPLVVILESITSFGRQPRVEFWDGFGLAGK